MALALFKKSAPTVTRARAALNEHHKRIDLHRQSRLALAEKIGVTRVDIEAADVSGASLKALQDARDMRHAQARYENHAPAADADEERGIQVAEKLHEMKTNTARAAATARRMFLADLADVDKQLAKLTEQTPNLVYDVLAEEELTALAAEFLEAEERLRAVHRKAFVVATAADKVATAHSLGQFRGSARYYDLVISRPDHPSFSRGPQDLWDAKLARDTDWRLMEQEADQLLGEFLNGTVGA